MLNVLTRAIVTLSLCAASLTVQAATVTTNEVALDAIFSQASFDPNAPNSIAPIDIRFLPTLRLDRPRFTTVDSSSVIVDGNDLGTEVAYLLQQPFVQFSATDRIYMLFVDSITACDGGGNNPNIVGCALINGNRILVQSDFASGAFGAELLGHEIAHNLGIGPHSSGGLMNATLNGETDLTAAQVRTIARSPLIQNPQSPSPFLQIQPVDVYDGSTAVVPLPPAGLALVGALGAFALRRRRTSKS